MQALMQTRFVPFTSTAKTATITAKTVGSRFLEILLSALSSWPA